MKDLYDLYAEDDLREPYAKVDTEKEAENFIRKPRFLDKALEKYFYPAAKKLNNYLARNLGVALSYGDLEIETRDIPPQYVIMFDKGKIRIGMVKPEGVYTFEDGRRKLIIDKYLHPSKAMKVFGHELVHYGQDKLGAINNFVKKDRTKARDYIEAAASTVADEVYGIYKNAYDKIKTWYQRKFGKDPKIAMTGKT